MRDNPLEIHVCDCYLDLAIKFFQKSVLWGEIQSDAVDMVKDNTKFVLIMYWSDIYVVYCQRAFFGFTNSAWNENFNLFVDEANDCLHIVEPTLFLYDS